MEENKVKTFFKKLGMMDKVIQFNESSATVELASNAIGCEPREIAKTLAFDVKGTPTLIVASGTMKIDNSKFKQTFNAKANMIKFDMVEGAVGHMAGGVCPFCVNENVKIYLDQSIKDLNKMYLAAGSVDSVVGLTLDELVRVCKFERWVDVCKE